MMPLNFRIEATFEKQSASSSCCGAGVDVVLGTDVPVWLCRECRSPCAKVMSAPEIIEVSNHG